MKKKITGFIVACALLLIGVFSIPFVFEKVDAGQYKIVQQLDGDIVVLDRAGWQYTGFVSNITTYDVAGTYYFSSSDLDGGKGAESMPIKVIYRDGAKADVNGNIQYKLPVGAEDRVELHKLYGRKYSEVVHNLIRQSTAEAVKQSATYFKGEEAYTYGRAEYVNLIEQQLEQGIFSQEKEQKLVKNAEGNEFLETYVKPKQNKDGNIVISKDSKFKKFNVEIIGLNIKDIVLDEKTMKLIESKKDAEFRKITARAQAEEARQNKITEELKGKARVAKAKAEEQEKSAREIEKAERNSKIATVQADKRVYEKEQEAKEDRIEADKKVYVATQNAKALITDSNAQLKAKTNEAIANAKLVKSGLTPAQRAEMLIRMNKDKWDNLSKANLTPKYVTGGGQGGDSTSSYIGVKTIEALEKLESKTDEPRVELLD